MSTPHNSLKLTDNAKFLTVVEKLSNCKMKRILITFVALVCLDTLAVFCAPPNRGHLRYGLRFQPELDHVRIDPYIKNRRLWKLEINCIIFDGPCDAGKLT